MIVNLVGPPGVGKSTFASRFVLEHPYYRYCSIDAYRVEEYSATRSLVDNELHTWRRFFKDIRDAKDSVVESVGTDYRLDQIFKSLPGVPRFTIALVGNIQTIEHRLRERQNKKRLPLNYDLRDEIDSIYYTLEALEKDKEKINFELNVNGKEPNDIYKLVTTQITNFRISQKSNHG